GSAAQFNAPWGVAVDSAGHVYVAEIGNHTISKITSSGVVTTLAGPAGSPGSANGTVNVARFASPFGVAVDSAGNIDVGDSGNNTIRKGTPPAGTPSLTTQPTNQTVAVSRSITFTVAASGTPTPTFQWQRLPAGPA